MPQRCFSFLLWSIRLAALAGGLLLVSADAIGQLTMTVGATATSCGASNGSITAIASGGQPPYTYTLDGGSANSTGSYPGLIADQYYVTVTDFLGNSVTNYMVFVSNGCLNISTAVQDATCGNTNGTLTVTVTSGGSGSYTYSIDGINYYTSNVFLNVGAGTYTVIVQDLGLSTIATALVSIDDLVGATITATPVVPASCLNDDGTVTVNTSGGTPPLSYSINGGSYGSNAVFSDVASGNQTISVQDHNGCLTSAVVTVPMNNNLTFSVGAGVIICQGTQTTLPVTSNAATFVWTPVDGLSNATIADPVADPAVTTTYDLTAVLGVCTQTGSVTVTVLPAPTASAGAADTICPGKSTELQGSGGVTYQWSPATYLSDPTTADPIVEQPARSITYSLTVFGSDGCASVQPASQLVYVTPPPVVFAGDDTAVLAGQPVPLDAIDVNNSGFTQYVWSPASGLNNAAAQDPIAQITGNITYTVTATTNDGCSGTGSIIIAVVGSSNIVVPNAFTPNGDGHNDVLKVDAIGIHDFKYFSIFNRWGQEVFTTSNQGMGWDGTRGGQVQPAGVYVWAAMGLDFSGRTVLRKGTVILIR